MLKLARTQSVVNGLFTSVLAAGVLLVGCTPKNPSGGNTAQAPSEKTGQEASNPGASSTSKSPLVKVREAAIHRSQAEGPPDPLERVIAQPKQFKLSQTQKTKLNQIQAKSDDRLKGLRQQIQQSESKAAELAAKSNKGELSLGDVRKQLMSTATLTHKLEVERAKDWDAALAVMTPDQRAKAKKVMKK